MWWCCSKAQFNNNNSNFKKNCPTYRSNLTQPNPHGLGWTPVIGWVGWVFFNPPWWVGLKKLLNLIQPDPCTPLIPVYVINIDIKKERKEIGRWEKICYVIIFSVCILIMFLDVWFTLPNCICIWIFCTLYSLIHISALCGIAVGCKSSKKSYTWWYEIICPSLFDQQSLSKIFEIPCLLLGVLIGFSPDLGFRKTDEYLLQESAVGTDICFKVKHLNFHSLDTWNKSVHYAILILLSQFVLKLKGFLRKKLKWEICTIRFSLL